MIQVAQGRPSEDVRQGSRHVLFVEGSRGDSFDPQIIGELFEGRIRIKPLGPSYNVRSVAEALHPFHPSYYFLIDRDYHHDDDFVNRCWDDFLKPITC